MDKEYGFLLVDGARNTILLPADELHHDIDTIIKDHISEVRPHPNLQSLDRDIRRYMKKTYNLYPEEL